MALTEINSLGIKDSEVKTADILDENVTTNKLADDAVTAAKIRQHSIICSGTVNSQSMYLNTVGDAPVSTHTSLI